jgi:hypothetical protein
VSRIIGDCLVAGGMSDAPDTGTAETEQCWPRPRTFIAPVEFMRAKVRGKLCDKAGDRVVAGGCEVHHA